MCCRGKPSRYGKSQLLTEGMQLHHPEKGTQALVSKFPHSQKWSLWLHISRQRSREGLVHCDLPTLRQGGRVGIHMPGVGVPRDRCIAHKLSAEGGLSWLRTTRGILPRPTTGHVPSTAMSPPLWQRNGRCV